MESRHVAVADGISRFLGLGALIVSLGSSLFFYQENQKLKQQIAEGTTDDPNNLASIAATWNTKFATQVDEFDIRASEALKKFDKAREARNRIVDAATNLPASGLTKLEVDDFITARLAELSAVDEAGPDLRLATSVFYPSEEGGLPIPSIRNTGNQEAEIRLARFTPRKGSEFKIQARPSADNDLIVIEFTPENNHGATVQGAHRLYERAYLTPELTIPVKKTAKVSIEIRANNRHLDWGMMGELELEYQDGRTVQIPNARAFFVPDPEETT